MAERALCTAAAEGTEGIVDPEPLGLRLGLKSWLFLRERGPFVVDEGPGFTCGRIGDVSREGLGEFVVDVDAVA